MAKMTLTEALANHKLVLQKIETKTRELSHYTVRDTRLADPMVKSMTTSEKFVEGSLQSINDLSAYSIRLRAAIAQKNREIRVKVGILDCTVEDALAWRRDVSERLKSLYNGMLVQARNTRTNPLKGASGEPVQYVVNFDEEQTIKKLEELQDTLAKLDMELSIINATQTVDVD